MSIQKRLKRIQGYFLGILAIAFLIIAIFAFLFPLVKVFEVGLISLIFLPLLWLASVLCVIAAFGCAVFGLSAMESEVFLKQKSETTH